IKHLGRVIAADPTWEDLNRRGRAYAQLGQYAPGAQDYMAASQLGGEDWAGNEQRWHEHALLLVASGDGAGYRKLCARLLQHVDTTKGYYRADAVATTCVLAPKAVPDMQPVVRLAEQTENSLYSLRPLGCALYRADRFKEARQQLTEDMVQYTANHKALWGHLFLAMVHHRLGHAEEAQKRLKQAMDLEAQGYHESWRERLEYQILRRDAEAMIKGRN